MASEIRGVSQSGTLYARIMNPAGSIWNGTTFETYTAANYANYDIAMTEQGNSGVYVADFPTAITTGGSYEYFVHKQAGASPAEGDTIINTGKVDWSGTASISASSAAMTGSDFLAYILRKGFKRTDKNTEVYEAITDAIQVMRRRFSFDEAETEITSTDTLATSGEFKIDIESDMGLLQGVIMEDDTDAHQLKRLPKAQFDELYPDINVTDDQGYPEHYCVFDGQIYVGPIPDATDYVFRLCYSLRAGTITSSTVGVPFTDLYREVLADKTLELLYESLEEYDRAGYHAQKFEAGFAEAVKRERKNKGEGIFAMRPVDC